MFTPRNVYLIEETLTLLKADDDKAQIWIFKGGVGEGWRITDHKKTGVDRFQPFAGIVLLARQPENADLEIDR